MIIWQIFDRMDRDRNGTLTLDEFNDGLKKLGIHVSRAEAKRITDRFSARSGGINYRDFLRYTLFIHVILCNAI